MAGRGGGVIGGRHKSRFFFQREEREGWRDGAWRGWGGVLYEDEDRTGWERGKGRETVVAGDAFGLAGAGRIWRVGTGDR
jgi:hypothetical protein